MSEEQEFQEVTQTEEAMQESKTEEGAEGDANGSNDNEDER